MDTKHTYDMRVSHQGKTLSTVTGVGMRLLVKIHVDVVMESVNYMGNLLEQYTPGNEDLNLTQEEVEEWVYNDFYELWSDLVEQGIIESHGITVELTAIESAL